MNAGVAVIFTCGTGVAVRASAVATPDASPMKPSSATTSHQKYRLPPLTGQLHLADEEAPLREAEEPERAERGDLDEHQDAVRREQRRPVA